MHSNIARRTLLAGLFMAAGSAAAQTPIHLRTELGIWTDEFDGLLRRRVTRILTPYSRTLFFQDRGRLYGLMVDGAQTFETWLNKTYNTGRRPLVVSLITASRDRLFQDLLAGRGDIAAGDITVTEERAASVAFSQPLRRDVKEVLVTPRDYPAIANADELSRRTVVAREATSTTSPTGCSISISAASTQPCRTCPPAPPVQRSPRIEDCFPPPTVTRCLWRTPC